MSPLFRSLSLILFLLTVMISGLISLSRGTVAAATVTIDSTVASKSNYSGTARDVTLNSTASMQGIFYTRGAHAGGSVDMNIALQSMGASGYINFTNRQEDPTPLCGAGNFSGAGTNDHLSLSFISDDPDPGCGFDKNAVFTITSTIDTNMTHSWGDYISKNANGSNIAEYPGVLETWTSGNQPIRISYVGVFTNTAINRGGPVTMDIAIGTNTVSGYMNFTNNPGEGLLCGGGEFTGVKDSSTIEYSFISHDLDPGCGFDNGLRFTINATLSEGEGTIAGTYDINGQGGGSFIAKLAPKAWTLMYYIAADNDAIEERRLQAQYDSLKATSKNPSVNIVTFWDGTQPQDTKYVAWVSSNETSNIRKGDLNTGDPNTLHDFIIWAQQNYPATHYALIISDHGNGVSGVALDKANFNPLGDYLTPHDLSTALSGIKKLDIVYMDACLMGDVETAYQLRDLADFYVASESVTWNFIMPSLFTLGSKETQGFENYDIPGVTNNTSPAQLAISMGESYSTLAKALSWPPSAISVGRLSNITDVATKTSNLAGLLRHNMNPLHGILQRIINDLGLQHYEEDRDSEITNKDRYVDLYHFAQLVKTNISDTNIQSAAQELMSSITNYVVYEKHWSGAFADDDTHRNHYWNHEDSHGVSVFFPQYSHSFYKDGWFDFTAGTIWNINGSQTALALPSSTPTIEWGPMLVEYVRATNPNQPDEPNPPELLAPQIGWHSLFLPMVRR